MVRRRWRRESVEDSVEERESGGDMGEGVVERLKERELK